MDGMPGEPRRRVVMSDLDEIRRLLQRYARAADSRDIDELRSLFHPEATIDGSRGVQTLDEWLASMAAPRAFTASMHVFGEPLVTLDGERGTLDTYAVVYQGNAELTLGIRYLDDVERVDGRWVLRRRTARTIWMK